MPVLSAAIQATTEPPIPTMRSWAAHHAAEDLLDLTQAVPGYPAHPELLHRLALAAGTTAYGAIDGDVALREAVATETSTRYGAIVTPEQVAITGGCNLAFAMVMACLAGPGARVGLLTPWFFNHEMTLTIQGATAVPIPCLAADGFMPDPARLAPLLDGLAALVLVSPNNPTGAIYSPALLHELALLCRARGVWLVLDETYRDLLPDGPPHDLFGDADWPEHIVHLYSFSKAYCVPGHRVGAVVGGGAFRHALLRVIDSYQICPARPAQAALAWAVPALAEWRAGNRAIMAIRAEATRAAVARLPGWQLDSLGAYFAYLRVPDDGPDAMEVAERLAVDRGLILLPGPFFGPGQERHLRLAFANAEPALLAELPARLA
ncbi:MAG: aminotransferase [Rubritepida sp.]|nr:aminotransferase [Rubritepida sp.]